MWWLVACAQPDGVDWVDWSPAVFEEARAEDRFVLLDLGANWCHWCHVMDEVTYADPVVVGRIDAGFLAVRADQAAHPNLAQRYEDYGWPATIVFAADGTEIVKRQGYLPPGPMASLLQAIVDDPTPGPSVVPAEPFRPADGAALAAGDRDRILADWNALYDHENAGWGRMHKFLDGDSIEYAVRHADDAAIAKMGLDTLAANRLLVDPVDGGVWQYSDEVDWRSPHHEKIMSFQAQDLRLYGVAWARWGRPEDRVAGEGIRRFLVQRLLSDEGAFYASQDADSDSIDTSEYARENGQAIVALCAWGDATGDDEAVAIAVRAAEWTIANRREVDGTFRHADRGGFLGDSVAMGQGFLALARSTGERRWVDEAVRTFDAIDARFRSPDGVGFVTADAPEAATGVFLEPVLQIDENLAIARSAHVLDAYTGRHDAMARTAFSWLASPTTVGKRRMAIGLVLAEEELASPVPHVTVVRGEELWRAARRFPGYARIDRGVTSDVTVPPVEGDAAFVCSGGACSMPIRDPEALGRRMAVRD